MESLDKLSGLGEGLMPSQTPQNRPESTEIQKTHNLPTRTDKGSVTLEDLGITLEEFEELTRPKTKREKALEYIEDLKAIQKVVPDNSKYMKDGVLVLPNEIVKFAGSPAYLNKYRFLGKHLGVGFLLRVYKIARTKKKPRCWFGKVLKKENLARTIKATRQYFEDLEKVVRMGMKYGIDITRKYVSFVMFGYWSLGSYKFESIMDFCSNADKPNNAFGSQLKKEVWSWLLDYRKNQNQA
ncbi:MAG: hypothetical protein II453_03700 [Alphaproteobacteria bacterium]|nr:hypothetical protein [Alphaproteobacteria bacterium]